VTAIIIDDHQLFSGGLSYVIKTLDEIDKVFCFDGPQTAIERVDATGVKLLICDLYIPGFDMFIWFRRLRSAFPDAAIVVLSSSISRTDRSDSLDAGADIYLEKHADPELLVSTLKNLLAEKPLEDGFLERTAQDAQEMGLTNRQIDILVHLSRGLAMKEIADRFDISTETVKSHLSRVYDLIGVSGRSAASDWAKRHGLL